MTIYHALLSGLMCLMSSLGLIGEALQIGNPKARFLMCLLGAAGLIGTALYFGLT